MCPRFFSRIRPWQLQFLNPQMLRFLSQNVLILRLFPSTIFGAILIIVPGTPFLTFGMLVVSTVIVLRIPSSLSGQFIFMWYHSLFIIRRWRCTRWTSCTCNDFFIPSINSEAENCKLMIVSEIVEILGGIGFLKKPYNITVEKGLLVEPTMNKLGASSI